MKRIPFLDSHTGGEPTRLISEGFPPLGGGSVAQQLIVLKTNYDEFRSQVINEPRGSDVLVGALLVPPADPTCQIGVIFFNNVGYLGMCGHGSIGVIASLSYQGKIHPGTYRIETPVGIVETKLHQLSSNAEYKNRVSVRNVPAYRYKAQVPIEIDGRIIHGDIAWGGNWFFLCHDHGKTISPNNIEELTEFAWRIRKAYTKMGIAAADGHEIDHVELLGPSTNADGKSFVLCPGKAYDRSPCGTGTSAKLACLVSDRKFSPGQVWRQESVVGSVFEGKVEVLEGKIIPTITGEAWVTSEGHLLIGQYDPFADGINLSIM
jgi:4-hydroxyproline epimerase